MEKTRKPVENHRPAACKLYHIVLMVVRHWFLYQKCSSLRSWGPSWSWPYGSWIYNYLYNQWLLLLMLWVWIPLMAQSLSWDLRQVIGFFPGTAFPPPIKLSTTIQLKYCCKCLLSTITLTLYEIFCLSLIEKALSQLYCHMGWTINSFTPYHLLSGWVFEQRNITLAYIFPKN